ncbi:MAG: hypothetical protein J6D87_06460 [Clostridia bacterium]|nr:hypothetical protein [Clostridia bacterium]
MANQKRIRIILATVVLCFIATISIFKPINASAEMPNMILRAEDVVALPGDTVQVQIYLENNPGLASLKFNVAYDEMLTLQKVEFSTAFGAYVTAPEPYKNPQSISFISPLSEVKANGIFATLTFLVSPNAPDQYDAAIRLICDDENIFDGDYNSITTAAINGKVHIVHGYPGDINGDRAVNNKDAILLFQYVAGMDVKVDADALDVNGDGKVNNRDAVILFRYVAGWDVEISRGPAVTVCKHEKTEIIPGYSNTCTEYGLTDGERCATCGEILLAQEIIPLRAHEPEFVEAKMPTCIEDGWTAGTRCIHCRQGIEGMETIPATGHYLGWRVITEPTCTESGWTETYCTVCSPWGFEAQREELSPLGHESDGSGFCSRCGVEVECPHDRIIVIEGKPSKEFPNCGKEIVVIHWCEDCELVLAEEVQIATHSRGDHNMEDGYCTECKLPDQTLVFRSNGDGTCYVYYAGTYSDDNMVIIPSVSPDGDKVVEIDEYAFLLCSMTTIVLPDTIVKIDWAAFEYCDALKNVYYAGSEADWAKIKIEYGNEALTSATIHYNYDPTPDPTGPAFIVSSTTAKAGDTVEVTVALKNNPGIASIILNTTFDDAMLDLQSVAYNTSIGGQTVPPQTLTSPFNLYWVNGFANATGDFVLVTLTFKVSDTAAKGNYEISLSYQPDNVYDITETNISFEVVSGKVTVK